MQARVAQVTRMPTGENLRFFSIKWAQNRSPNITAEVKTKRIFPCVGLRMLPVMFWIQLSVPNSTAPTRAWTMKRTKISQAPIEPRVKPPTESQSTIPAPQERELQVELAKNSLLNNRPSMPPRASLQKSTINRQTTAPPNIPTSFIISPRVRPFSDASDFGIFWPRNMRPYPTVGMRKRASCAFQDQVAPSSAPAKPPSTSPAGQLAWRMFK